MLGCRPRSVCLRSCRRVMSMLYILYKISRSRKVLLEILTEMQSVWNTKDGDIKYVLVGCAENCVKLGWKRLIFRFLGHVYDVVLLFWRCVLHFNVIFFVEKGFQPFWYCFPVHCSEKHCFFITPWQFEWNCKSEITIEQWALDWMWPSTNLFGLDLDCKSDQKHRIRTAFGLH